MDLKEVLEFFLLVYKRLLALFVLGLFIGVSVSAILPKRYISSGTLFIGRNVTESKEFYSYSGYYDQQTALSFTNTVRGLLENKNLHAKVLEALNTNITEKNLRNIKRKIKVRDAGPQLINLDVKAGSIKESEEIWINLVERTTEFLDEINKEADSKLFIKKSNLEIYSRELKLNPFISGIIGGLSLSAIGCALLSLKTYFYKDSAQKEKI